MADLTPSRRVRATPFTPGVEAAGVRAYTVYNHTALPTIFESVEADCAHLKRHVQVWDVSCQRQVAIRGPDAAALMRRISPRDIRRMADDQCYYLPVTDHRGGMLNDPVAIRLAADHYWLSLADGDLLQWVLGLAVAQELEVEIDEPDVSPLAVQGPKADALMARVFGDAVRDIRFFRYRRLAFEGREMIVARSGFSGQGGFEIYVDDGEYGMPLWQALMAAGGDLQVRAGCPNLIERVESGLLSYGNDMTRDNTPHECGLGKYLTSPEDFIGKAALVREAATGPARQIRAIEIAGQVAPCRSLWPLFAGGKWAGQVASAIWSPDAGATVAIGMVERAQSAPGTQLEIETGDGTRKATVRPSFWN